jgi:Carboxypeptidase regulatory-like domain/TonB dependent receptor
MPLEDSAMTLLQPLTPRHLLKLRIAPLTALIAVWFAASVWAFGQSQSINGTIRGQVADITGAPLQGATVTAHNDDTGFTRVVSTDSEGLYVFPDLPIGNYSVSVSANTFAPIRQTGIRLDAGMTAVVSPQLHPGQVSQEVQVEADASVIEPASVDISTNLSSTEVSNAPLTSRNPYDLVLFQPGVSGVPNQELGIPDYVNTNGLVDRVNYQLDGMDDTETDQLGLRLFAISETYVNQVQQVSNAFNAEFGNTDGIIYNAITGSGTNKVHGMLEEIWRPSAVNSRPMLLSPSAPTPDSTLSNPAMNIGGPIIPNKLFFFGSYEYILRGEPNPDTISPANAAALGLPASQLAVAPEVEHAQFVDSRVDWTINAKNSAFVRFNYFRNEFPYNSDVGGLYALSAASNFHDRAYIEGAQLITTFSSNLLNEFRGSWPYRNEKHVNAPTTGPGPMVDVSGVAYFNGTNINGTVFQEKIPSFNDNLTWIKGQHSMKFGFSFTRPLLTQESPIYSEFVFPSIAAYQAAASGTNPYSYSQLNVSIGHPGAGFEPNFYGLFAQDTWQMRKTLVVSYGLRYDLYSAPSGLANAPFVYTQSFNTPKADFSPRLGLSWQVRPTTVVRANMGVFYLAPTTDTWYEPLYNNGGTTSLIAQITPTSACAPAYPNTITSVNSSCLAIPSITATTPHFKNEYAWNGNLQVEQQLSKNDALTVAYVLTNGRNIPFDHNLNLINPIGALADGRPVFSSSVNSSTRLYPQFNNILLQDIGSNSSYNAALLSYNHRFSQGFSAIANYTYGHSIDDAAQVNSYDCDGVIEDPTDRDRDRGNSCVDRPNTFNLLGVFEPKVQLDSGLANGLINGNQFETTFNFGSGIPQNEVANTVLNGDTETSGYTRPLYVGRNTLRGPGIYQVDLRYSRSLGNWFERFTPRLFAESNNLFNRHSNITTLNETATVAPLGAGGVPTSASGSIVTPPSNAFESTLMDARILEFGVRIDF